MREGREGGLGTRHDGLFWDSSSAHCGISDLHPRRKTKLGLRCLGLLQKIPHCPKPPRIPDFLFVSSATCANSVGQGWPHKARSVISFSPGTEALGAGTKKSLSLSCAGILAINPECRSSPLSWALSAGLCGGRLARPGGWLRGPRLPGTMERLVSGWKIRNELGTHPVPGVRTVIWVFMLNYFQEMYVPKTAEVGVTLDQMWPT